MVGSNRCAAAVALLCGLLAGAAQAESVDCDGGAVAVGQGTVELLGKCGEPSHREEWTEERTSFVVDQAQKSGERQKIRVSVARWTYDFGPRRFLQFVSLENGRILGVTTGGYGSARAAERPVPERVAVATCDAQRSFNLGDTPYEILSRCGEPASRERKQVERTSATADAAGVIYGDSATVNVETWTYNFGPRAFLRRLKFVDGKLVKVSTADYGYH